MTDITVYHNAMSASSQKLRLALAEKQLPWRSEEIELLTGGQHTPAYRALNPAGVVPTLVHGAAVLTETSAILEYLDEVIPDPPLRPADPVARHAMRRWMARLYEDHHRPNGMLSYTISARLALLNLPPDKLQAMLDAMPSARDRALRRVAIGQGFAAPEFTEAVRAQEAMLDAMETELVDRDWLASTAISLADIVALPYVVRIEHMGIPAMLAPNRRPYLADWLRRCKARPSYDEAIERWVPAARREAMARLGELAWPEVARRLRAQVTNP
jgi:glutathione S-transferase